MTIFPVHATIENMDEKIIRVHSFQEKHDGPSGFNRSQFKKLDALYLQAAAAKTLIYRTVECDFDEGVASYTYYKAQGQSPYLQFLIRKVGPRNTMFELYKQDKGRIAKSGLFERVLAVLKEEIGCLKA